MHQSKLIVLLKSLSKVELNHFIEFTASPFFNKNSKVNQLLQLLVKAYPRFSPEQTDRKKVYQSLFNDKNIHEQKLRYLSSDLTSLLENFLAYSTFEKDTFSKQHFLLDAYRSRNISQFDKQLLQKEKKLFEDNPYQNGRHYRQSFLYQLDVYNHNPDKREISVEDNLREIIRDLDIYYIINKLQYSAELINHTNLMAGEFEPLLLKEILTYLESHDHDNVPEISIYYQILKTLLDSEDETHYTRLKEKLLLQINQLSASVINDMYVYARNYCVKKINLGRADYLEELFELYKTLIEKKIIFRKGYLSQWDYKNIVATGLRLKAFDWVKNFVIDYQKTLIPQDRKNAFTYNLALYHFHIKQYDKTLNLLKDVLFTDVYYHLDSKSLLMKTYYEMEESDPLYSLIEAFYAYLRRNKSISKYQMKSYSNFLHYAKRLLKYRYRRKEFVEKLKPEIELKEAVANKTWLLAKINELLSV